MTQMLQFFYGLPKKSSRNFAIFAKTHDQPRVSSSIIELGDTLVSDASFGIEVEWALKN